MSIVERISVKYCDTDVAESYPVALLEDAFQPEVVAISAVIPKRGICEWVRTSNVVPSFYLKINGLIPLKHTVMRQNELLEMFQRNEFVTNSQF